MTGPRRSCGRHAASAGSIGRNIGAALAAGLESMGGRVGAAAAYLVGQANIAMKAAAMFGSPSKLAIWWGHMIGEGLAIGIENMGQRVAAATARLIPAEPIMRALQIISRHLKAFGGENTPRAIVDIAKTIDSIVHGLGGTTITSMRYPALNEAQWSPAMAGTVPAAAMGAGGTTHHTTIHVGGITVVQRPGEDGEALADRIAATTISELQNGWVSVKGGR